MFTPYRQVLLLNTVCSHHLTEVEEEVLEMEEEGEGSEEGLALARGAVVEGAVQQRVEEEGLALENKGRNKGRKREDKVLT
jgi:hypothetical protein